MRFLYLHSSAAVCSMRHIAHIFGRAHTHTNPIQVSQLNWIQITEWLIRLFAHCFGVNGEGGGGGVSGDFLAWFRFRKMYTNRYVCRTKMVTEWFTLHLTRIFRLPVISLAIFDVCLFWTWIPKSLRTLRLIINIEHLFNMQIFECTSCRLLSHN